MATDGLACLYAALVLSEGEISAEKISDVLKAAKVKVNVSYPTMVANGLKTTPLKSLLGGFSVGGGAAPAPAAAPAASKKEEKAPEPEPEEDDDMGLGLFD
eukprot:416699_1